MNFYKVFFLVNVALTIENVGMYSTILIYIYIKSG